MFTALVAYDTEFNSAYLVVKGSSDSVIHSPQTECVVGHHPEEVRPVPVHHWTYLFSAIATADLGF